MDRKMLESAATRVTNLRGLVGVPSGLLFIAIGLGNLGWGLMEHDWAFIVVVLVLVAVIPLINRFYDHHYGKVALLPSRQFANIVLNGVLLLFGLIAGIVLDFAIDLPMSPLAICFGAAMLGWYALAVGLRIHHMVLWGGLLVAGLVPMWGTSDDKSSVALLVVGAVTMVSGLFDHLTLVQNYRVQDDNA